MAEHTRIQTPSEEVSNEADSRQLELAKGQGAAAANALRYLAHEVADSGEDQRAGEYVVTYALENAEGLYHLRNGELEWVEPDRENLHVEVAVRDGADGRIVPGLRVLVTLIDSQGREIGTHEHPLLWHPCVNHYGRNWYVPGDGEYTIRVRIEPPQFPRHDKINGCRFKTPVEVTFRSVHAKTGRKKSD